MVTASGNTIDWLKSYPGLGVRGIHLSVKGCSDPTSDARPDSDCVQSEAVSAPLQTAVLAGRLGIIVTCTGMKRRNMPKPKIPHGPSR